MLGVTMTLVLRKPQILTAQGARFIYLVVIARLVDVGMSTFGGVSCTVFLPSALLNWRSICSLGWGGGLEFSGQIHIH